MIPVLPLDMKSKHSLVVSVIKNSSETEAEVLL